MLWTSEDLSRGAPVGGVGEISSRSNDLRGLCGLCPKHGTRRHIAEGKGPAQEKSTTKSTDPHGVISSIRGACHCAEEKVETRCACQSNAMGEFTKARPLVFGSIPSFPPVRMRCRWEARRLATSTSHGLTSRLVECPP